MSGDSWPRCLQVLGYVDLGSNPSTSLSYDMTWLATQPFRTFASNLPCGRYLTDEMPWGQSYSSIRSRSQLQFSSWLEISGGLGRAGLEERRCGV